VPNPEQTALFGSVSAQIDQGSHSADGRMVIAVLGLGQGPLLFDQRLLL
jgi:hypothetical protein